MPPVTSTPEVPVKDTLEFALRPYALPIQEVIVRHPHVVPLVAHVIGVVPRAFGYLEIWPPAFETYALVVPALFDIPRCDAGGGIGPAARSLVAYASSRGHGCMYCAAHSASLGSVFSGAGLHMDLNQRSIDEGQCALTSPRERALVDFGLAVAKVPGALDAPLKERLAQHFTPRQFQKLALVASCMGLLNHFMDSVGMVLEAPLLKDATRTLTKSGWDAQAVYDGRFDKPLLEADHQRPPPVKPSKLQLTRHLAGALRFESRVLAKLPKRTKSLEAHLNSALGFSPYYLELQSGDRVRRTLAHLLIERVARTPGALGPPLASAVCFKAAKASKNPTLAAHFATIGVHVEGASGFARLLAAKAPTPASLALRFAERAAMAPARIDAELCAKLVSTFSPQEIVELVLVVGIYSALHRLTLCFPAEHLEQEVEACVAEYGTQLGMRQGA